MEKISLLNRLFKKFPAFCWTRSFVVRKSFALVAYLKPAPITRLTHCLDDTASKQIWNVGRLPPKYTVPHTGRFAAVRIWSISLGCSQKIATRPCFEPFHIIDLFFFRIYFFNLSILLNCPFLSDLSLKLWFEVVPSVKMSLYVL
jgi:hypothetical protein